MQRDAKRALGNYFVKEGGGWGMPGAGYRLERSDGDRVLYSYDVEGWTWAAVIVADRIDDWKHHTG